MPISDSQVAHLMPINEVRIGTKLLFINLPDSWRPKVTNFYALKWNHPKAVVGTVLSVPKRLMGSWNFKTDLQPNDVTSMDDLVAIFKEDVNA